jgi:hypothetical protein
LGIKEFYDGQCVGGAYFTDESDIAEQATAQMALYAMAYHHGTITSPMGA